MTPEHRQFAQWDAAYVLGALPAADRHAYEAHLDGCEQCRRAVAELAPTAALLSRLPAAQAEQVEAGPRESSRTGLIVMAEARARRRRTAWVAAIAAAVLVVAAVAVPLAIGALARPTTSFALVDVADVPLTASVALTDVAWGTRIELECAYPDENVPDVPEGGWTYALAVVGADGTDATVSTWRAGPGTSARISAGSALDLSEIEAIEIRTAKGVVLMRHDLADG
jgi:hypothetical protein